MLKIFYEAKYQFLINKWESKGLKHLKGSKGFIEYLNDMTDIYKNIEEYHPNRKCKILIAFNNMNADMLSSKKLNPLATELFINCKTLNISPVLITQSYFAISKNFRLTSTHQVIIKILNKRERKQIALNHSYDIDFKYFVRIKKNVLQSHIASDNPSGFRDNLFGTIKK